MRKGICEWDRSYLGRGEEGSVRKKSEARKAQYRPGGAIYVADPPRHTWIVKTIQRLVDFSYQRTRKVFTLSSEDK